MIKVYYLRQVKSQGVEYTEGYEYIFRAINEATKKPNMRRVVIEENPKLKALALNEEEPTKKDIENYDLLLAESMSLPRNLEAEMDEVKMRLSNLEKR